LEILFQALFNIPEWHKTDNREEFRPRCVPGTEFLSIIRFVPFGIGMLILVQSMPAVPTLTFYFLLFHILTNYSRNFQFYCWNYLWCGILYTEENMNDHMHIIHYYWQVMKMFIHNSHILESLAISIFYNWFSFLFFVEFVLLLFIWNLTYSLTRCGFCLKFSERKEMRDWDGSMNDVWMSHYKLPTHVYTCHENFLSIN